MDRSSGRSYSTRSFMRKLLDRGKHYDHFDNDLGNFREIATSTGFDENEMSLIADVIKNEELKITQRTQLIKLMIPEGAIEGSFVKSLINWFLSSMDTQPPTIAIAVLQWLFGVWEYELTDRKNMMIYYGFFFSTLTSNPKLAPQLVMLIHSMTKPEKISRRHVRLIEEAQQNSKINDKYYNALLSLFKTFKPELVPQQVNAANIEHIWRSLPETMVNGFEAAKIRMELTDSQQENNLLRWNPEMGRKREKLAEPLIPSVSYFQFGSEIFDPEKKKSLFEMNSLEDFAKFQFKVKLPNDPISLLNGPCGFHLLTFADEDYKNKFKYRLYTQVKKALITESEKYTAAERNYLLKQIAAFCSYMQQGISILDPLLASYLCLRNGDNSEELLMLLEWSFGLALDFHESFLEMIKNMFNESSLEKKIRILIFLKNLINNIFALNTGEQQWHWEQSKMQNPEGMIAIIFKLTEHLMTTGLLVHAFNPRLLSTCLMICSEVLARQRAIALKVWLIAPDAVIYGSFTCPHPYILSKLCHLLLRYRRCNNSERETNYPKATIFSHKLSIYVNDLACSFVYSKAFSKRFEKGRKFLSTFPQEICAEFSDLQWDKRLTINYHAALLPYMSMVREHGGNQNDYMNTLKAYAPYIVKFIEKIVASHDVNNTHYSLRNSFSSAQSI